MCRCLPALHFWQGTHSCYMMGHARSFTASQVAEEGDLMCGIWGVVNIADQRMAETAARSMFHRGPDDYGTYVATDPMPVSLVNTRLAIIDLSPAGHQPMTNEDSRYWIVYNGEMYNFQPLREA